MHLKSQPFSPERGKEYLVDLQCLAGELETAMNLVAEQKLSPLQESIKIQEAACSRLAHMQRGRSTGLANDMGPDDSCTNSDLALQIEEAISAVLRLNQRYAALLKHSGETLRLFAGLFRSYQGTALAASSIPANHQTWSCEV